MQDKGVPDMYPNRGPHWGTCISQVEVSQNQIPSLRFGYTGFYFSPAIIVVMVSFISARIYFGCSLAQPISVNGFGLW